SIEDIANTLHQLPDRVGFVNNGNAVYPMRTADLDDIRKPLQGEELGKRWRTIIDQTKKKYCKGREEIRAGMLASFIEDVDEKQQLSKTTRTKDENPNKPVTDISILDK